MPSSEETNTNTAVPNLQETSTSTSQSTSADRSTNRTPELVLMKFGAPWCPPCRLIDRELEKIEQSELPLKVRKIDVDADNDLSVKYGVSSIPHVFLLEDGEVVAEFVGYRSAEDLSGWVREHASRDALAGKKSSNEGPAEVQSNPFFD